MPATRPQLFDVADPCAAIVDGAVGMPSDGTTTTPADGAAVEAVGPGLGLLAGPVAGRPPTSSFVSFRYVSPYVLLGSMWEFSLN